MREIRVIETHEVGEAIRITLEAFPAMSGAPASDRSVLQERYLKAMEEPTIHYIGVFEDGQMVGSMRFYDFTMQLRSVRTLLGGVGAVAVDLRHKREHIAADMIAFYHDYYRDKGASLTALYPFRPDFYKRMGYGYGIKMNRYSFRAGGLSRGRSKARVDFLTADDKDELLACYQRLAARTNGLFDMPPYTLESMFNDANLHKVGVRQDGRLEGYMTFVFEKVRDNNFLLNNMVIRALVYDNPAALSELLTFIHSQDDQFDRIIYETQDDRFHVLLNDPRNGSGNLLMGLWHEVNTQGTGIMYRVIDVPRLFAELADHDFGGQTCRLRIALTDTFMPENGRDWVVDFVDGRAALIDSDEADVTVSMDVSEFSSLITGALGFRRLFDYGLAELSDQSYLETVDRLFHTDQPPFCMTHF